MNIPELLASDDHFKTFLWTGNGLQLAIMTVLDEAGMESHPSDQLMAHVSGIGRIIVDGVENLFTSGSVVAVNGGAQHNIVNDGDEPLKLFTVYGPPEVPATPEVPD